jgi:RNA polymerase sigma factor (sigma-70 family)
MYVEEVDRLTRLAYLVGGDRGIAEDAVSNAVSRVLPRWRAGRVREPVVYLRRAVVNEVLGALRRRGNERRAYGRVADDDGDARDLGADVAHRDLLRRALRELSVEQRAVLVLRFFDDLTEAQTAAVLRISAGTVKSRTARALERLRGVLAEESHDD